MTLFLLCASGACLLRAEELAASQRPDSTKLSCGRLTFGERVAYQYAIEEVYWRHRIWPKENPQPKPALDEVVSPEQIENKVKGYLRDSQLLAGEEQRLITPSDLQAEMDRMAAHTHQPETLREIFAMLGNDAFVIAECLARPILSERLLTECKGGSTAPASTVDGLRRGEPRAMPGKAENQKYLIASRLDLPSSSEVLDPPRMLASSQQGNTLYKLPEIVVSNDCADNTWTATSTINPPEARFLHTAVWTGSEMIIFGGASPSGSLNTGARYNPATDNWTPTNIASVPARSGHTAIWTGREMIIWGGGNNSSGYLIIGGRYNPTADSWADTTTANAPIGRDHHTAVWTGSEMIIWGGAPGCSPCSFNTGGRYNPSTDSWIATSTINAPIARLGHTATWTGSEMIIWGGSDDTNYLHTGGKYNPTTDSWAPTGLVNVPSGRYVFTAVWSGSQMIVWGGVDESFHDTNTGGRYDPSTDSWIATGIANAPTVRDSHSAVWTGREMIVWAGTGNVDFNNGKRYNPADDSWTPMTQTNAPFPRASHTAVWTGNEMIAWGGVSFDTITFLNTGGRYCAQPSTPIVQSVVSRKTHGNAGQFDVNLPLSGTPGVECRSGGPTGDYTIVASFLANVSVSGNPQASVTSGIGSIGSGGVVDGGAVVISGNVVTIPLTNVANAQTINVTLNNVNGSTNVTIPMRILVGDVNGNGSVNASDVIQTKINSGQTTDATNFRSDANANGTINASDVSMVKTMVGTAVP